MDKSNLIIWDFQHHCFTKRSRKQGLIFWIYHVETYHGSCIIATYFLSTVKEFKRSSRPKCWVYFASTSTWFVFKKTDIYMYRFCDSVSVILILCIKSDNSFMGDLLQDVNNYLKAVLYFLKASCFASGLILQNCLMVLNCERVLGYHSLNKRRLCWEASRQST